MKVIAAVIIFTLLPVINFASDRSIAVRARRCNFVETKERHGDDITVRDRYGNITRTERHEGRQEIIRDRFGNIIGTEDAD